MSAAVSSPRLTDDALLSASASSLSASLHDNIPAVSATDMPASEETPSNVEPPGDMDDASPSASSGAATPPAQHDGDSTQPSDAPDSAQNHDRQDDVEMEGTAEPEERPLQAPADQAHPDVQPQPNADNDNAAASDDEDEPADEGEGDGDGDGSESEEDDYDYELREFLERYKQDASVPSPEELEEMHKRRAEEVSALDDERWIKQAFTPLDDPEHVPLDDTARLMWTFDGFHGTKEAPNKLRFKSSEPVVLTNHDGKQYQFSLKVFPRGNDGTDYMSVYIECAPVEPVPAQNGEDIDLVDKVGANWWEVTAQFGCVMYNPTEPRVHRFQKSHHQFTSLNSDFGWPRFAGPWSHIHVREHLQYRPLLQDDKASFTAFIRLVRDPTRALWYHNQFPQNPDWDSMLKTGYRGLATASHLHIQSALVSALAIWFELAPFRNLIEAFELNNGLVDPLSNFQPLFDALKITLHKKQRSRKIPSGMQDASLDQVITVLEWYGYQQLPTVLEVWNALEELLRHEVTLGLQRKPSPKSSQLAELLSIFFENQAIVQPAVRPVLPTSTDFEEEVTPIEPSIDYTACKSTQELASTVADLNLAKSPQMIFLELPRQVYDSQKRKWSKTAHKIKLDSRIEVESHSYQLYGFVCHIGELGSGRFQPVIQPRGPNTPWLRWSTRNSSRGSVLPQTYRQAVTAHEGSDGAESSSAVASVVAYLREDVADQLLILGPERELHDVYNPLSQIMVAEDGTEVYEIVVAAHLSTGFSKHKHKTGFVDTWNQNDGHVITINMRKDETLYDMHEKLKTLPQLADKQFCVWPLDMQRDIRQFCPPIQNVHLETTVASLKDYMNGTHVWVHVLSGDQAQASQRQYEEIARNRAAESLASLKQSAPAPVSVIEHSSASSPPDETDGDVVMGGTDGGEVPNPEMPPTSYQLDVLPLMPASVPMDSAITTDSDATLEDAPVENGVRSETEDVPVELEEAIPPPPTVTMQEPMDHIYVLVKHFHPLEKIPDSTHPSGHRFEPAVMASGTMLVQQNAIIKDLINRSKFVNPKVDNGARYYRERPGALPVSIDGSSSFAAAELSHGSTIITEPIFLDMQSNTLTGQGFPASVAEHFSSEQLPGRNTFGTGWSSCPVKFGRQHGSGTIVYANGDAFSGRVSSGKRSGRGTMFFANGCNYQGEWRDDHPHGNGTMIYAPSGNKYVGPFQDGKQHGEGGVTYWRDASVNENTCRICYVDERNTVFVRCGHMVACQLCAQQVSECPVCRRSIEQVVRVWDTLQ